MQVSRACLCPSGNFYFAGSGHSWDMSRPVATLLPHKHLLVPILSYVIRHNCTISSLNVAKALWYLRATWGTALRRQMAPPRVAGWAFLLSRCSWTQWCLFSVVHKWQFCTEEVKEFMWSMTKKVFSNCYQMCHLPHCRFHYSVPEFYSSALFHFSVLYFRHWYHSYPFVSLSLDYLHYHVYHSEIWRIK